MDDVVRSLSICDEQMNNRSTFTLYGEWNSSVKYNNNNWIFLLFTALKRIVSIFLNVLQSMGTKKASLLPNPFIWCLFLLKLTMFPSTDFPCSSLWYKIYSLLCTKGLFTNFSFCYSRM
jgi:hypothetical protein